MGGLERATKSSEGADREGVIEQPAPGIAGHYVVDLEDVVRVLFRASGLQAARAEVVEDASVAQDDALLPVLAIATFEVELSVDVGKEQGVGGRGGDSRGNRDRLQEATE